MRALVLDGQKLALHKNYPMPLARAGECLIRVLLAGVCSTDIEMTAGYKSGFKGVLGHEFVGEVVEAPDAAEWLGQRVVGEINIGCGDCELCRRSLAKHCRRRQALGIHNKDGAFAEFLTLPIANLHRVPDSVTDEEAVFVEPLAAALRVQEQVQVLAGDRVAVVGDGRLGLLCSQVIARSVPGLVVFGHHEANLQLLSNVGAATVLSAGREDYASYIDAFDVVVEATGAESGFYQALDIVRPGGAIVLKSTFARPMTTFESSRLVVDEVTIVGSRCGPFEPALRLLERRDVDVQSMVHASYALDRGEEAVADAAKSGVLKVLIRP